MRPREHRKRIEARLNFMISSCLLLLATGAAAFQAPAVARPASAVAPAQPAAPPGDAVALALDCAGVPREARRLLAARLRRGL